MVSSTSSAKPVLIVDDDEDTRAALACLLQTEGYATACADNGATALTLLRQEHLEPCMILLDLNMPVMDGATFRNIQRDDPRLAAVPVAVYSGVDDVAKAVDGLCVAHVFQKPLNLKTLVNVVRQHCGH
ncbi:MAG: response regulator [Candidatus Binatia bacterium]